MPYFVIMEAMVSNLIHGENTFYVSNSHFSILGLPS